MVDAHSTDPLAPQYEDPSTLERQPPPAVVTYKKEDEAAEVQPAPAASVRRGGCSEWEEEVREGHLQVVRESGGYGGEQRKCLVCEGMELDVEGDCTGSSWSLCGVDGTHVFISSDRCWVCCGLK